jgi:hypothetical protein
MYNYQIANIFYKCIFVWFKSSSGSGSITSSSGSGKEFRIRIHNTATQQVEVSK